MRERERERERERGEREVGRRKQIKKNEKHRKVLCIYETKCTFNVDNLLSIYPLCVCVCVFMRDCVCVCVCVVRERKRELCI